MTALRINMSNRSFAARLFLILPVLVLLAASTLHADDVVTHWNKVMLTTIAAGGTDPITSTRTTAIVQPAVFDSVNGIERKYTPVHTDVPAPNGASAAAAIIESAHATLVALYPDQEHDLKAELKTSLSRVRASSEAIRLGREYGVSTTALRA